MDRLDLYFYAFSRKMSSFEAVFGFCIRGHSVQALQHSFATLFCKHQMLVTFVLTVSDGCYRCVAFHKIIKSKKWIMSQSIKIGY